MIKYKKIFVPGILLVALALIAAACGGAPTAAPAATQAPAAQATQPPATEPTQAPAAQATQPSGTAAALDLWHGQTGAEEEALQQAVTKFQEANPGITIELLAVPSDQLNNKFTTEASTGGGPDLMIGPKDRIGELAQAGLIQPLDDVAEEAGLNNLNPAAVDANKFQGKVWAFPESTEAVGLYYNTDKIPTPPKNADELLQMAQESGFALDSKFYHSLGILASFGAQLLDEEGRCILDQGEGTIQGLEWLKTAKETANVITDSQDAPLDAAFKDGQVAMIFNGPWASGDYVNALGEGKVAIAPPIEMGSGKFAPFLGTKNVFLSANTTDEEQAAALKFMNFLSQPDTQSIFVNVGHIPSNPNVEIDNPIGAGFLEQTKTATYFPNEPEMGAVWTPAGDMITKVLEGQATPAEAAKAACETINSANKK